MVKQQTHGIKNFDSFNNFISKQKLQKALKSWSNVSLVLFAKGQEKHKTKNPCNNFDKSTQQLREIHVSILTNP